MKRDPVCKPLAQCRVENKFLINVNDKTKTYNIVSTEGYISPQLQFENNYPTVPPYLEEHFIL